jgi:hypothetical protein
MFTHTHTHTHTHEGVSKSFWTDRLEIELQMVQLSVTRCSCITILWVSLVSFAAITLFGASERVFIVVSVYFVIDPSTYIGILNRRPIALAIMQGYSRIRPLRDTMIDDLWMKLHSYVINSPNFKITTNISLWYNKQKVIPIIYEFRHKTKIWENGENYIMGNSISYYCYTLNQWDGFYMEHAWEKQEINIKC